jgi:hypothetical protein
MTTTQVRAPSSAATASATAPIASYDQLQPNFTTSEWLILRYIDPKWKFVDRVVSATEKEAEQRRFLLSLKKKGPIGALTLPDRGSSSGGRAVCRSRHGGLSLVAKPDPRTMIGSLTIPDESESEGRTGGAFSLNEQRRLDRHALVKTLIDTGHLSEEEAKSLGYTMFDVASIMRKKKIPAGGMPFDLEAERKRAIDRRQKIKQLVEDGRITPDEARPFGYQDGPIWDMLKRAHIGSGGFNDDDVLPMTAPTFQPGSLTLPDDSELEGRPHTGGESYLPAGEVRRAITDLHRIERDIGTVDTKMRVYGREDPKYRHWIEKRVGLEREARAAREDLGAREIDDDREGGAVGGFPFLPLIAAAIPVVGPLILKGLGWIWGKLTGKGINPPNGGGIYPPNARGGNLLADVMTRYMQKNGEGLRKTHKRLMKQEGKDFWKGAVKMAKGVISDVLPELMDTTPKVAKKMAGMVVSKYVPASFQRYCDTSSAPEGGRKARRAKKPSQHKRGTGFTVKSAGKTLAKWAGLKILDNVPDAKELKAEISKAIDNAPEPELVGSGVEAGPIVGGPADMGMEGAGEETEDGLDDGVVGGPGDQGMEGAGDTEEDGEYEPGDEDDGGFEGSGIREAMQRVKEAAVRVKNKVVGFLPGAKTWASIKTVAKVALTKVLPMIARVGENAIGPAVQFILGKLGVDDAAAEKILSIVKPAAKAAAEYARRRDKEVIEAEKIAEKKKRKDAEARDDEERKSESRARERKRLEDEQAPKREKESEAKRAAAEAKKAAAEKKAVDKEAQTEIAKKREERLRLEEERLHSQKEEMTVTKAKEVLAKAKEEQIDREKELTAARKVLGKVKDDDPTALPGDVIDEDEDEEGGSKRIDPKAHPYHAWLAAGNTGSLKDWMISRRGTGKSSASRKKKAVGAPSTLRK